MRTKTKRLIYIAIGLALVLAAAGTLVWAIYSPVHVEASMKLASKKRTAKPSVAVPRGVSDFGDLLELRLQGKPEEVIKTVAQPKTPPKPSTRLPANFSLVGILYSTKSAIAQFSTANRQLVSAGKGDTVGGVEVVSVAPEQVTVIYQQREVVMELKQP